MEDLSDAGFGLEISRGVVAQVFMALVGFGGSVVFARLLGPGGYGGFYLLLSLVQVGDNPVSGWANACKKRFSEGTERRDEIVGAAITMALLAIGLATIVTLPLSGMLESYTNQPRARYLILVLFAAMVLFISVNRTLAGTASFSMSFWMDALRSLFTIPFQLGLVLSGMGVVGMVYGLAGATLLLIPIVIYTIGESVSMPSTETLRSLASFAKYSIPNSFIGTAYDRLDVLLLGFVLTPVAVGEYEVALKFTIPATFIASVSSNGLMARVSNQVSRGEAVADDIVNTLSFSGLLAIPIFFGALAIGEPLVRTVYGGDFASAAPLLVGLALFRVIEAQGQPLRAIIDGIDAPKINTWISLGTVTFNLVLGYGLAIRIGAVGVVIATVLAETVRYLATAMIVHRRIPDVRLFPRPLFDQIVSGFVMYVAVTLAHRYVSVLSWVDLVVLLGIGASTYFVVLVAISPGFRITAKGIAEDAMGE